MDHQLPAGIPAPDDLLDALKRAAPGLARDCWADVKRLRELVPALREVLDRVNGHGNALDAALWQVFGGPARTPDGAGELAARLTGVQLLYELADQVAAAHPDAPAGRA